MYPVWRFGFIVYVSQSPHVAHWTTLGAGVSTQYQEATWNLCVDCVLYVFCASLIFICSYNIIIMDMIGKYHSILFYWNRFSCSSCVITNDCLHQPEHCIAVNCLAHQYNVVYHNYSVGKRHHFIECIIVIWYSKFNYQTNLIYNFALKWRAYLKRDLNKNTGPNSFAGVNSIRAKWLSRMTEKKIKLTECRIRFIT